MRLPQALALSTALCGLVLSAPARADDAQGFIEQQHQKLERMLHAPPSPTRDAEVNGALGGFVDYDDLVQHAFGEPCPATIPTCDDLWAKFSPDQRAQVHDLLRQVVEASYRRNLTKTLDYDVTYRGTRDAAGDIRVLTEAKSKTNPRDTPVRVDYVVKDTPGGKRVVDIITEGSSFTKNLYTQFRTMMQEGGYDRVAAKLRDKIAKG